MKKPLVSIICTAYNHESFVENALRSVMNQTYASIELLVIDNASSDRTSERIEQFCQEYPHTTYIKNAWNKGLCTAFNQGLKLAKGKYIIDLSADDVLLPNRVEQQVNYFERLPENFGVIFSNAVYINESDQILCTHFDVDENGHALDTIPSGDVYRSILERYFICTPTMMIRRSLLEILGGYDESLTYEDFDFWVRSSTLCAYGYQDEILTQKRVLDDSLSQQVFRPGSGMLESTYKVCNKAYDLNRTQAEFDALANRIRTFIRKCFYAQEFELALRFRQLLTYIEDPGVTTECIIFLCKLRLPINRIYRLYLHHNVKNSPQRKDFRKNFVIPE
ncbi:glycosyltransferase family 2 protein [Arundinibacter roseus]|nr:glycosyltransferase [Arundinibacter roseus]